MNHVDKIISTKWLLNEKNNSLLEDYSVIIDGNIIKDIIPSSQVRKSYTTIFYHLLNIFLRLVMMA